MSVLEVSWFLLSTNAWNAVSSLLSTVRSLLRCWKQPVGPCDASASTTYRFVRVLDFFFHSVNITLDGHWCLKNIIKWCCYIIWYACTHTCCQNDVKLTEAQTIKLFHWHFHMFYVIFHTLITCVLAVVISHPEKVILFELHALLRDWCLVWIYCLRKLCKGKFQVWWPWIC